LGEQIHYNKEVTMQIDNTIPLDNYDNVISKLNTIREKPEAAKKTSKSVFCFGKIKIKPQKYVVLQSDDGDKTTIATIDEIANLAGLTSEKSVRRHLKTADGRSHIIHRLKKLPYIPLPAFEEMRVQLEATKQTEFNKLTKHELLLTIDILRARWDEILDYGQWDSENKVLHLRRDPEPKSDRKWSLPRSVEIHQKKDVAQIYVLHKGNFTAKLGRGAFKEVSRAVNLNTLESFVHATIDIEKRYYRNIANKRKLIMNEIQIQNRFWEDEFVHIAGWTEYKSKSGSPKIAIISEHCNGGELYEAAANHTENCGIILNQNIDELMQVVTDLLQMLIKLEHKGIVNRDIKPENVFLVVGKNGHIRAKMGDFGLAISQKSLLDLYQKKPAYLCGTANYLPPEVAMLDLPPHIRAGYSTQIWEMGVLLHCLFTCLLPLYGKDRNPYETPYLIKQVLIDRGIDNSFTENNPKLLQCLAQNPKHLYFFKNMVRLMLQVDPRQRPSAADLLKLLEDFKK
jgi:hypothetical protein